MKRIALIIGVFLLAAPCFAQVTVDNAYSAATLSGTTHTIASVAVASHSNRVLVFCDGYVDNPPATLITGVTFNGSEAFTRVTGDGQSTNIVSTEMWILKNPTVTTASVVATFSGSETGSAGVLSAYNVDQTTPVRNSTSSNGTAATTASGALTSVSGDLALACVHANVASVAPTGTETLRWNVVNGSGFRVLGGETIAATTTTTTPSFTFLVTGYGFVAADLKQATASGLPVGGMMMGGVGK